MQLAEVVIVTGSRLWEDWELVWRLLDVLQPRVVVQGGALGADSFAHGWAKKRGRVSITYFPDYSTGKGAPLRRNVQMLDDFSDACVLGFPRPDSRGTWYTMKQAEDREMRVINGTDFVKDYE